MNLSEVSAEYLDTVRDFYVRTALTNINTEIMRTVTAVMANIDIKTEIEKQIMNTVNMALQSMNAADVSDNLIGKFHKATENFLVKLTSDINSQIINDIHNKTNSLNITDLIVRRTDDVVMGTIQNGTMTFPPHSIKLSSLDLSGLQISGAAIVGGKIRNFESTGIQDLSTDCKLTITDHAAIVEHKIITKDIDVLGNFNLLGKIPVILADNIADRTLSRLESKFNDGLYKIFSSQVIKEINQGGIDFSQVRYKEDLLVDNDGVLNKKILSSNLQTVGVLHDLVAVGEILLDDTVFVSSKRMGINTMNPDYVMEIWDQEAQLIFTKQERNTAFLGSKRQQRLILGTADRENLICEDDGSVSCKKIKIGSNTMSSEAFSPDRPGSQGEIVWNERPQVGQPIGWVSLGGARWAQFGTIQD